MTLIAAVRIARFCFGLSLLWTLFYLSVRSFLLDELRQKLFAIRDDLFDFAMDGAISFDDQSYRELRDDINSLIRFADKLSFMRLLLASLVVRNDHPGTVAVRHWTERVMGLDPLVRKKLLQTRHATLHEVIFYIVRRSLILYVLVSLLKVIGLFVDTVRNFIQRLPKFAEPLEAQAHDELNFAA
ncbi:MAG TPA: hypothetical protein VN754_12300 [Candidatus Binataceae bacterium]|nr:hypothetical protein [Candidatus Binataceae bacterium]